MAARRGRGVDDIHERLHYQQGSMLALAAVEVELAAANAAAAMLVA